MRKSMTMIQILVTVALAGGCLTDGTARASEFLEPDVRVLYSLTPENPVGGFGFVAENIGDIDGDGIDDYLLTGVDVAHVVAGTDSSPRTGCGTMFRRRGTGPWEGIRTTTGSPIPSGSPSWRPGWTG